MVRSIIRRCLDFGCFILNTRHSLVNEDGSRLSASTRNLPLERGICASGRTRYSNSRRHEQLPVGRQPYLTRLGKVCASLGLNLQGLQGEDRKTTGAREARSVPVRSLRSCGAEKHSLGYLPHPKNAGSHPRRDTSTPLARITARARTSTSVPVFVTLFRFLGEPHDPVDRLRSEMICCL